MQADPAIQALLVRVAAIDAQSALTAKRKTTLPQHAELTALNTERIAAGERIVATQARIGDAQANLERLDADLETARTRLARDRQRLDDGVVSEAKQIAGLEAEITHLTGRISALEDDSLEAMQAVEDDEVALAALMRRKTEIEDAMRALIASRDADAREADAEVATLADERASLVAQVPADLMAVYTKVASRLGTGAAELEHGRCTGCGLMLDAVALRAATESVPETVIRCEECGRLLVRPVP